MIKFLLVMQICSGLYGNCMPEQTFLEHDTWSECSRQGTINTLATIDMLGDEYINTNKLYVKFTCREVNTT
tara:strand:+ start:445 stop:657 length:213 start_codon:yes stop_codon:yes gene_type:complete